jgi:hypothetical protein
MRKGIEGLAMLVQRLLRHEALAGDRACAHTALAEAIRYTLSRWKALCRFVDDGRIELEQSSRARDQAYHARP